MLGLLTFLSVARQTTPDGQAAWPLGVFLGIVVIFIGLFLSFVVNTLVDAIRRGS